MSRSRNWSSSSRSLPGGRRKGVVSGSGSSMGSRRDGTRTRSESVGGGSRSCIRCLGWIGMIAAVLPLELIVEGFLQLLESLKGPSTVSRGMIWVGSHLEIVGQDVFDPIVRRSPMFVAPREPVIHAGLLRFTCGFPGLCLAEFVHQGFHDLLLQGSAFLPPTLDHAFPDFSVLLNIEVVHSIIRPSFQGRESAKAYLLCVEGKREFGSLRS